MGYWDSILYGFVICMKPMNLLLCFMGCLLGTLVGVLPGVGPAAAISILLPVTISLDPIGSTIMLAGIFYGTMYGGSTTSILVNIPGEIASVVTCLDGYQMARKGRAGPALGISAFGSFIAGTLSVVFLSFMAPPLSTIAIQFGSPEYFCLMVLGLTLLIYLVQGSMLKAMMMALLGLIVSLIGIEDITGFPRFTFGIPTLEDGIGLVPVAMGVFGVGEVLINLKNTIEQRDIFKTKLSNLFPNLQDWKDSWGPILRGSLIGFFIGIIPGAGSTLGTFAAYAVEKRISKHPEKFGTGVIEGVAAPESANNAGVGGQFIPLMTLGIPTTPVMALILGALIMFGLQPGPLLIERRPDLFWGIVASMYLGNIMLLILNLPLIGMWVKVLRIPYPILFPLILLFCLIGSYSINNSMWDVFIMCLFGVLGFFMRTAGFEGAPLLLGIVLGPMLESDLRKSLIMSNGSFSIFMTRPISAAFLLLAIILIVLPAFLWLIGRKTRLTVDLPEEKSG